MHLSNCNNLKCILGEKLSLSLFFLIPVAFQTINGQACPETDLSNFTNPVPSAYLSYKDGEYALTDDNKLLFKCSSGRVINSGTPGYYEGGFYAVNCTETNGTFALVEPTWPLETACITGNPCNATLKITDIPSYLRIALPADPENVASGNKVKIITSLFRDSFLF